MADMIDSLIVNTDDKTDPRSLKHEDQFISRFGSRFSISLDLTGKEKALYPVGLGPLEGRLPLFLAVREGDLITSMPLHYPVFDRTTKPVYDADFSRTMTSATCKIGRHGSLEIEWKFISPFYPRDYRLSCAPFFYISARVKNVSDKPVSASIISGLEVGGVHEIGELNGFRKAARSVVNFRPPEYKPGGDFGISLALVPSETGASRERIDTTCAYWECVSYNFELEPGEEIERTFILAYWHENESVVTYHGESCGLKYRSLFKSQDDVLEYAIDDHTDILRKSALFDSMVEESSITNEQKYFIPRNFHVYLGSTWMLERPDGSDLFLSYEGGTGYFATIDVEYNLALFYALFWPDLLKSELQAWADTYRRGNRLRPFAFGPDHRIMEHDIGGGFVIDEQIYIPGPMPVEENANFLLLTYLYWRFTGDLQPFEEHTDICKDLADYIVDSDLNGNGLPDIGVTNTLDCFISLFHDMGDQVFLGLKAAGGLVSYVYLLEAAGKSKESVSYKAQAEVIFKTVEDRCWLGDHYAVTIHEAKPQGWDQPTPLTLNGIAYLLFTGQTLPLDHQRVRMEIDKTEVDYTHWPSMGIWRDIIGLYYGHLPKKPYVFRPDFISDFYPRNFNSLGLIMAGGGIGVDIPGNRITFNPSLSGRFPLPMLADWENETIPWIEIEDGTASVKGIDAKQISTDGTILLR